MSIVSVATWKVYSSAQDGDAAKETLYQTYLDAAEAIVVDYLGFSPSQATYTSATFYGEDKPYIQLKARPITIPVTTITVDGVSKTVGDFIADDEYLVNKNGVLFPKGSTIVVTYQGGYATIPGSISMAIMRIATLLHTEGSGQIGVSSQTLDGGNTRSFVNYTNYQKYLAPLQALRIVRLKDPGK
jgi:hypothetical protein